MARVVVTGATGAQAGAVADAFAAAEYEVTRLSRRAGAGLTSVDPDDADALARVLDGADVLAHTCPIDHRPGVRERLAEQWTRAAEQAEVGAVVLNTAASVPDALHRPVAEVLRAVRATMTSGTVPSAVIEPTVYMDNLAAPWLLKGMADGVLAYPAPASPRIAWISHRSLGEFAVAAARAAARGGRRWLVGGPEALMGDEVAAMLGGVIGRPLRYEAVPLDAFAATLNASNGAPAGDDIADLYRYLDEDPAAMTVDGTAATGLGVVPESLAQWAARQNWSALK